jgi:tRNA(Ile)-lysidine synthase
VKKPGRSPQGKKAILKPRYAVPKDSGGRLARALVAGLKSADLSLPLSSHILCACSGGSDSTALAVALARYGRRVGPPSRITLLHVNHGWRGDESDADEEFVRRLAERLGVGFVSRGLAELPGAGDSWEAHAREARKRIYSEESARLGGAVVLTAHTADDQAETRLWRILTGAFDRLGSGILTRHEVEVRPLLAVRKELLRKFLLEEGETWREDSSNDDTRFLRARMRKELMPAIERLFPRAIESLNSLERPGKTR